MKRIAIFGVALTLSLGLASCGNSQNQKSAQAATNKTTVSSESIAKNVNTTEFKQLIETKKNGVILDVRTPQEVAQGAIVGSVHMNFYAPDFKEQLKTLDKNAPVMVYCAVGGRSGSAMQVLNSMGFKEVYNLAGGINAWRQQGLPTGK
ncbi:MAG: rhodanese-like domain-containing protein [Cyclobacteriaceae bacterium]|nr:rhodanese-like domain-containing protein [Cyclobacteriaceae bacterium]